MIRILLGFLFASLTVCGTFITLRLPFIAARIPGLPDAQEIIRTGGVIFGSYASSLQLPAVWLSGIALGPFWGAISQLMYLALGIFMPAFIDGGGAAYFSQPTAGYLLGFVLASWIIGKLRRPGFKHTWLAMTVGQLILNACGALGQAQGHPDAWMANFHATAQLFPGQLLLITTITGIISFVDFIRKTPKHA